MPFFYYKALDKNGKITQQKMDFPHIEALRTYLEQTEHTLLEYRVLSQKQVQFTLFFRRFFFASQPHLAFLIDFCFYLAHSVQAGIPLLQSLSHFQRALSHHSPFHPILLHLIHFIQQGLSFSHSLSQYPQYFPPIMVALVKTGEKSGTLTSVLFQLYETLQWRFTFKNKLKQNLLYPILTLIIVTILLVFLFYVVIPELVLFLDQLHIPLPLSTRLLIYTTRFVQNYGFYLLCSFMIFLITFHFLYHTQDLFRKQFDKFLLSLKGIGSFLYAYTMTQLFHTLRLTYTAGIPLIEGLQLAEQTISNTFLKKKIAFIYTALEQGLSLSESFERSQLLPHTHFAFIQMGEQTGELEHGLMGIEIYYKAIFEAKGDVLIKLIEPILTIFIGIILIWIIFAIFVPLYSNFSKMI